MTIINLDTFARVASEKVHKKYIEGGNSDEYTTAEDLIEELVSSMKRIILNTDYQNKDRILNLYVYCMKQLDPHPDDLYNSKQWKNIVTSVRNYLIHVEKYSIEDWEDKGNL